MWSWEKKYVTIGSLLLSVRFSNGEESILFTHFKSVLVDFANSTLQLASKAPNTVGT